MAVSCLVGSEFQAESVVNELKVAGVADPQISVLLPERAAAPAARGVPEHEAPGAPARGGRALGWLGGIEALSIPGAGAFIARGPILNAIKGAALESGQGGFAPLLEGMGVAPPLAKDYERKLLRGRILIWVFAENPDQGAAAAAIFEQAGAEGIARAAEAQRVPGGGPV